MWRKVQVLERTQLYTWRMRLPPFSAHRYNSPFAKSVAWALDIFAALVVVAALSFGAVALSRARSVKTDYSTKPPEQVFEMVLNQPVPPGVSDIRVAGFAFLTQAEVWMRFSATNDAIVSLMESRTTDRIGPKDELVWVTKERVEHDPDARAVGWDEVLHLKRIKAYQYDFVPAGTGWVGAFIVDRANSMVYVQAGIL